MIATVRKFLLIASIMEQFAPSSCRPVPPHHFSVSKPPMQKYATFNFTILADRFEISRFHDKWYILFADLEGLACHYTIVAIKGDHGTATICQEIFDEVHTRIVWPALRCFKDAVRNAENGATTVSCIACIAESAGLTCGFGSDDPPPCKMPKLTPSTSCGNTLGSTGENVQQLQGNLDDIVNSEGAEHAGDIQMAAEQSSNNSQEEENKCYFSEKRIHGLETKERPTQSQVSTDCGGQRIALVSSYL
jgi:hypothetical protein